MQPSSEIAASRPPDPSYDHPDWVILGVPQPNGQVMVLASKKLKRAELEVIRPKLEVDYELWDSPIRFAKPRCFLHVEMSDFVMIVADTYEQAFRGLFESWSPDSPQVALEAP